MTFIIGNEPRPAPDPQPKVWIGGSSEKALLRAARHGDGWCPFFSTSTHSSSNRDSGIQSLEDLRQKIDFILGRRQQQQLDAEFDINIAISSMEGFANRSPDEADQFIDEVRRMERIGVTWVTVKLPHPSRAAYVDNVGWFGEEVVQRMQ